MKDLDIIKQIEKELNVELEKSHTLHRMGDSTKSFYINQNGQVTGVYLFNCKIDNFNRIVVLIKDLKSLKCLNLENNQLSDISPLINLCNLEKLNLDNNLINDISPLKDLRNLTELRLYRNQISNISSLKGLKNLNILDLQNNPLEELSEWITAFNMELQYKKLWGNHGYISFYDNAEFNEEVQHMS